jgi:two-component system phosphate regulon sensor histidine kinase PhoR
MEWPWNRKDPELTAAPEQKTANVDIVDHLVAALPDPILILDSGGIVIKANANAEEMLEMKPVGLHLSQTIRAPAVLEAVARAISQGESVSVDYEVRGPLARNFEVYVSPIASQQAESPAVLLVLKDLTREQQIERMRSDFVANASHELRTPLASLSGFIETLQGAARSDEAARDKFLNLMRGQAERMKRLIDDLLSLSRIEMNAHLRPSAKVDLGQIARHVCDLLSVMAKEEKIELKMTLDVPLEVAGDWDELVQVLHNLVENAIKYSSAGTRVTLEGASEAGFITLSVTDQGRGIAEQHIPRLTERFYRISVQESRSRGGTGLGLAIVKHILNRHRGRLLVSSKLGHGSTFTIRLPAFKN